MPAWFASLNDDLCAFPAGNELAVWEWVPCCSDLGNSAVTLLVAVNALLLVAQ